MIRGGSLSAVLLARRAAIAIQDGDDSAPARVLAWAESARLLCHVWPEAPRMGPGELTVEKLDQWADLCAAEWERVAT